MRHVFFMVLFLAGCPSASPFDPQTFLYGGLRPLTVIADPPEVGPGESTRLTAYVVTAPGVPITYRWSICLAERGGASGLVDKDCVLEDQTVIAEGQSVVLTVPKLAPEMLGVPDATQGFYLPIRLDISSGGESDVVFHRLRYSVGLQPRNRNPLIDSVEGVAVEDVTVELDQMPQPTAFAESTPIEVGLRNGVRLRTRFVDGSTDSFPVFDSTGQVTMVTEQLRVLWFATAGTFTNEVTGEEKPDTVFRLDEYLPEPGATIDLYVVVADQRGGQAVARRSLVRR